MSDDAQHSAPRQRSRGRRRSTALLAALVLTAVAASAAASAALSQESGPTRLEADLQDEIDAMIASGIPADHPKVRMLEESLAALEAGADAPAKRDRGADVGGLLAEAEAADDAGARVAAADAAAAGAPLWESGTVECEPVPGLLAADEIAGAVCVSVPQPDGTNRYVAVGADGVARTVLFGADGLVQRLADTPLPAPPAPGEPLTPTPDGDLQVGAEVVDVG
jgi:hypothetical protein